MSFRKWLLRPILHQLWNIVTTQAEFAAQITAVKTQVDKIGTESSATLQKVKDLEAIIVANAPGAISPELQAALDDLKTHVQSVDDLVPDAAS